MLRQVFIFKESIAIYNRNFGRALDEEGIRFLADVCKRHGLSGITLVLLPITEAYRAWHDRLYPEMAYQKIRQRLKDISIENGLTLIDLGGPIHDGNLFKDYFHLSDTGKDYFTPLLCQQLSHSIGVSRH